MFRKQTYKIEIYFLHLHLNIICLIYLNKLIGERPTFRIKGVRFESQDVKIVGNIDFFHVKTLKYLLFVSNQVNKYFSC